MYPPRLGGGGDRDRVATDGSRNTRLVGTFSQVPVRSSTGGSVSGFRQGVHPVRSESGTAPLKAHFFMLSTPRAWQGSLPDEARTWGGGWADVQGEDGGRGRASSSGGACMPKKKG
jgi:hypothetical protein